MKSLNILSNVNVSCFKHVYIYFAGKQGKNADFLIHIFLEIKNKNTYICNK